MKVRPSLRQADWLRELHGLLFFAMVVSGLVGVLGVIATFAGQPLDIEVPGGGVLRADSLVNAPAGTVIDADAGIYLRVENPSNAQLLLATVAAFPSYALTTTMLVLLWRLVGAARHTDPFTGATIRRLRILGWLLIVGGPIAWVAEFMARFALSDTATTAGPRATLDLRALAAWFLVGVGILAIGEVVRRGQALRAELDEVV